MGGSSSKSTFFWQKKKSPLDKAWSQLRGALPNKKHRKKNILSLDKLSLDNLRRGKHTQKKKRLSLTADKKEPISLKRFSLGNTRKESVQSVSLGKKEKDGGGLGEVGEQIKRKLSQDPKKRIGTQQEAAHPSVKVQHTKEDNTNGAKVSKKKLSEMMRSIRS